MQYSDYRSFRETVKQIDLDLKKTLPELGVSFFSIHTEGLPCWKKLVATWAYQFHQSTSGGTIKWNGKYLMAQNESLMAPTAHMSEPMSEEFFSEPHPYIRQGIEKLNEKYER